MQAVVEQAGELLGRGVLGQVGPADIADEERIAREHGEGTALRSRSVTTMLMLSRAAGRLQKLEPAGAERDDVAVAHGVMGESGAGASPR